MENNGCDEVMAQECGDTTCPEATVEIKIKTLDSQTYTLRVDKCVPVPALKEQVATVTGILSGEQRLICRGKVLKDDQLLSAYHVEDGHTLHLVVRQPIQPSLDSSGDHSDDSAPSSGHRVNQFGPSVVVEAFNMSEPGGGVPPGLSQIISALLGSFGVTNIGSGTEGANLGVAAPEGLSGSTRGGLRNSGGPQTDQTTVIPDSLPTLSQYLATMINEFTGNGGDLNNSSQADDSLVREGQDSDAGARSASGGLPTLASLADVMLSTRQLLSRQTAESLSLLARLLENQANVTDPVARSTTQAFAIRSGIVLQHLGAFLLELGRATMALRMGLTPAEAMVNAGPAVFISPSGPNPIMVQPLPTGTEQHGSGTNLPRSIDIWMRTANQGEATGTHQPQGQSNQSAPAASGNFSSTREQPALRAIPISVAALPASVRPPSARTRVSVGLLLPVGARVRRVSTGNLGRQRGPRSSQGARSGQQPNSSSTVPPASNTNVPGSSTEVQNGFDQFLRSVAPGEHIDSRANQGAATATTQESEPVSGNGDLFSHLLQQIMPIISENTAGGSAAEGEDVSENRDTQTSSTQGQESTERGTRTPRHGNPPSSPSSKRQRR